MNTIVCATGVDLLMEYLDGAVPDDLRRAIDAHVGGCARCQAFVASYVATSRVLRAATAPRPPAGLEASLLAALRAKRGDPQV